MSYYGPYASRTNYCYECGQKEGGPYILNKQYKTLVTLKYDLDTFLTIAKVGTWDPDKKQIVMHFDDIDGTDSAQRIENNGIVVIRAPSTPSTPHLPIFAWVLIIVGSNLGTLFLTWMLVKFLSQR